MDTWPATLPPPDRDCDEDYYKPQIRDEFEANYVQTGPAATRGRYKLSNKWKLMAEDDFQTLKTFFDGHQGQAFTYTHPITEESLVCIFSTDYIRSKWYSAGWRSEVQCPIEEV